MTNSTATAGRLSDHMFQDIGLVRDQLAFDLRNGRQAQRR
jgi:hypothetical protein